MTCGNAADKLWASYLKKYGDFRERLRILQNDRACSVPLPLARKPCYSRKSFEKVTRQKQCQPMLPIECCVNERLSLTLSDTDRRGLERLMEAENFPDNLFPSVATPRLSIEEDMEAQRIIDSNLSLSSQRNTELLRTSGSYSIVAQSNEQIACGSIPVPSSPTNLHRQLLERLRRDEKIKLNRIGSGTNDKAIDPQLTSSSPVRSFLSFFTALDDRTTSPPSDLQTLDENSLSSLFSVSTHLSSSIYVPTNVQRLHPIPKVLLRSLTDTPADQHILARIEDEVATSKRKFAKSPMTAREEPLPSPMDVKLADSYAIRAFKEFLLQRNPPERLPEVFRWLDRCERQ